MPAKDIHHDLVHRLLVADGWRVTHDPYRIVVGRKNLFVDLGAEKLIAANRDGKRIAVEVKSFEGPSEVHDLEVALGQYLLYLPFLRAQEPERQLYLLVLCHASADGWYSLGVVSGRPKTPGGCHGKALSGDADGVGAG
jgi:hypothetical protein